jgi:hypothetical protein
VVLIRSVLFPIREHKAEAEGGADIAGKVQGGGSSELSAAYMVLRLLPGWLACTACTCRRACDDSGVRPVSQHHTVVKLPVTQRAAVYPRQCHTCRLNAMMVVYVSDAVMIFNLDVHVATACLPPIFSCSWCSSFLQSSMSTHHNNIEVGRSMTTP